MTGPTTRKYRKMVDDYKRTTHVNGVSPEARRFCRILLGSCFTEKRDRAAHTVLGALFDKTSSKDLTATEVHALSHILPTVDGADYQVVDRVCLDMRMIVKERLVAAGQLMLELQ